MRRVIVVAALLALTVSCTYSFHQYVPSLTPVNTLKKMKIYPKVTGKVCTFKLFYFIPFSEARINEALHAAVPVGSDYDTMIGVTIESSSDFYLIGNYFCYHVSGYPAKVIPSNAKTGVFSQVLNYKLAAELHNANQQPVKKHPVGNTKVKPDPVKTVTPDPVKKQPEPSDEEIVIKCDELCANYSGILKNKSALIKNYVNKKCMEKCDGQNMDFIECAYEAKVFKDVEKCNKL